MKTIIEIHKTRGLLLTIEVGTNTSYIDLPKDHPLGNGLTIEAGQKKIELGDINELTNIKEVLKRAVTFSFENGDCPYCYPDDNDLIEEINNCNYNCNRHGENLEDHVECWIKYFTAKQQKEGPWAGGKIWR